MINSTFSVASLQKALAVIALFTMVFSPLANVNVANAAGPDMGIAITTINGQSAPFNFTCPNNPLFNPISIVGSGYGKKAPGKNDQYKVQINWGDGVIEVVNSTFTPPTGNSDFTFTYNGSHTYTTDGVKSVSIKLYHTNAQGQDGPAEAIVNVQLCIDVTPDANLTVNKALPNNSGSTATANQFSFQVNGGAVTPFEVDSSNNVSLPVGTVYSVTESAAPGFTTTYSAGCSGTITAQGATCTITNDDQPGTLVVKKVVSGGPALVDDFSFEVNGGSATAFDSDGQNEITVNAGTYTVVESDLPIFRYSTSYNNCENVSVSNGETETCTITNTYVPAEKASITVLKTVINDNGGTAGTSTFQYFVNGFTQIFHNVAAMFTAEVPTLFTLTESSNNDYVASVWGGDCAPGGTVTLSEGGTAVCTITNDDISPKLTINKVVFNDDETAEQEYSASDFSLFADAIEFVNGVQQDVDAGTYTISETGPTSDYNASYSCVINGGQEQIGNQVTLELGDIAVCTITNDDKDPTEATITINKEVVNGFGGDSVASDFSFQINGGEAESFIGDTLNGSAEVIVKAAGDYTITEVDAPGYSSAISCVGVDANVLDVKLGDSYSCTIVNTQLPACSDGLNNDGIEDSLIDHPADPGCENPGDTSETDPATSITIDKVAIGEGASQDQTFNFNFSWTQPGLDIALDANDAPITTVITPANGLVITEDQTGLSRWNVDSIVCTSQSGVETDLDEVANSVTLNFSVGEQITCVFTNEYTPRDSDGNKENIIIKKEVTEGSDTEKFFSFDASWMNVEGDADFVLKDGQQYDSGDLSAEENYSVMEMVPEYWSLESVSCVSDQDQELSLVDSVLDIFIDVAINPAQISLEDGETVTCTFTNNEDYVVLDITTSGDGEGIVTSTSEDNGISCDSDIESDCTEVYPRGAEVFLSAVADEGSNFDNSWAVGAGTCTGNNTPCSVVMSSSLSLNAHFAKNSSNGGGGGGGGSRISLSRDNDDEPEGEVLGEATSVIPAGAPNTGAGGTSPVSSNLPSLFAILALGAAVRKVVNGK